ncbi:hypothetical protein ACOSQ3_029242 [Xanthoceras sorbifolium]
MNFIFEERRTLWVRDRTQRVRRSNPSGFDLEPRRVRRTTNPLGSRSNPEGSKTRTQKGSIFEPVYPEGFMSSNPSGFDLEPRRVRRSNPSGFDLEPRRVRRSNPLGSTNPEGSFFEPSGFHEPRGFVLRTLWVPRTQKGSYLRTLLGSRSNPEGSIFEPSGFHEPRGFVRSSNPEGFELRTLLGSWNPEGSRSNPEGFDLRTLWVPRTQRVRSSNPSNPLGSTNPEGSFFEPRRVRTSNPSGFVEPRGFEDRTLGFDLEPRRVLRHEPFWVRRHEPRRVRSSNPSGFEIEPRGVRSSNPLGSISNPEGSSFFEDELRR